MKTFPCVTVYMSSLTNMAIAVDRYRFIVRSQSMQVGNSRLVLALDNSLLQISNLGAVIVFLGISLLSCGLAFPIMYKTKLLSLEQMMVRALARCLSNQKLILTCQVSRYSIPEELPEEQGAPLQKIFLCIEVRRRNCMRQ